MAEVSSVFWGADRARFSQFPADGLLYWVNSETKVSSRVIIVPGFSTANDTDDATSWKTRNGDCTILAKSVGLLHRCRVVCCRVGRDRTSLLAFIAPRIDGNKEILLLQPSRSGRCAGSTSGSGETHMAMAIEIEFPSPHPGSSTKSKDDGLEMRIRGAVAKEQGETTSEKLYPSPQSKTGQRGREQCCSVSRHL